MKAPRPRRGPLTGSRPVPLCPIQTGCKTGTNPPNDRPHPLTGSTVGRVVAFFMTNRIRNRIKQIARNVALWLLLPWVLRFRIV